MSAPIAFAARVRDTDRINVLITCEARGIRLQGCVDTVTGQRLVDAFAAIGAGATEVRANTAETTIAVLATGTVGEFNVLVLAEGGGIALHGCAGRHALAELGSAVRTVLAGQPNARVLLP